MMTHPSLTILGFVGVIFFIIAILRNRNPEQASYHRATPRTPPCIGDPLDDSVITAKRDHAAATYDPLMDPDDVLMQEHTQSISATSATKPVLTVLYVLANEDHEFGGYDLLQSVLAADLRYGDMNVFHYTDPKTQASLFSLACAEEPGTFDIHSMGGFTCHGLCLFMESQGNTNDIDTFNTLLATATYLAEQLNGTVCDGHREILTEDRVYALMQRIQQTDK